jgi:putative nucleotidyltransferase with HDIG domain
MTTQLPEHAIAALDKVPPLRGTVLDLLRSLNEESVNTNALAKKIGHDPVLSARVLKIVNSPFYGLAGQVASLSEAAMVLGFSNLRGLALAASLAGGFPLRDGGKGDPRRIWRHSFCCALVAQALAPRTRVDAETAFTAGLLHDIGRIALLAALPEHFERILQLREEEGRDDAGAEQAVLGCTHAAFGARLLERWRLPPAVVRAVEFHHAPDVEPTSRLTDLTYIGDHLSHALERGALEELIQTAPPTGAFIRLELTRAQCREALVRLPDQLEAVAGVLN